VQEMTDWVEYSNATEGKFASMRKENGYPTPLNVKIWSVGNERSGRDYIHKVRDAGSAMKELDSTVLVTCSGIHGGSNIDPYLFEAAGEYLDYISAHQYWIENWQKHSTPDYLSCMMLSEKPESYINKVIRQIQTAEKGGQIKEGQIKIAFDEWNLRSWHHPGFQRFEKVDYNDPEIIELIKARDKSLNPSIYTLSDALFSASFLNSCIRNSDYVTMANIAPLVNQTGPLYVHPEGIVRRTHFHTISMYVNELQGYVSDTEISGSKLTDGKDSVSVIDAIATVDEEGKNWAISLVNRHPSENIECKVIMGNKLLNGTYKAKILTGESTDSYNDIENPNRVAPKEVELNFKNGIVQLPPHSLTIVQIKGD
jgi:alpha-N-arabinofuranosidase